MNTSLIPLGWHDDFTRHAAPFLDQGFEIGRIANEQRGHYYITTGGEPLRAEPSGKILFTVENESDLPKTGDWVAFVEHSPGEAIIHGVLPRRTVLSRKQAGEDTEQILAANVDVLFIMQGLDRDFNLRRIERYLVMARGSGITPIILLNKADLHEHPEEYAAQVQALDSTLTVVTLSALSGNALNEVEGLFKPGMTACIAGSSGVGKSTLVNRLLGAEAQSTSSVREDDQRGRHTTTSRSLFNLPSGGVLIDTPGMRELSPWADGSAVSETFEDIEQLMEDCRFRDCTHTVEAGCAVLEALESGDLDAGRYRSYQKLQKELDYLNNTESYRERKERILKAQKQFYFKVLKDKRTR